MPEKAVDAERTERSAAFRRARPDSLTGVARRLAELGRTDFPSQEALLGAVRRELRRSDPALRVGARRLRRLLLASGLARFRITYSSRTDRRPLVNCPVCGEPLRRVVNRTLEGDRVVLGYACGRCGYWTHLKRRVPIRYAVHLARAATTDPRSG